MTFHWYISFLDHVEYKVYSHAFVRSIEVHNGTADTIEYMRDHYFNHQGNPFAFERQILSVQGGAIIVGVEYGGSAETYWQRRAWTPELYAAFVTHLQTSHDAEWREIEKMYARYDSPAPARTKVFIPKPMYWSEADGRYLTESWFEQSNETAGAAEQQETKQ